MVQQGLPLMTSGLESLSNVNIVTKSTAKIISNSKKYCKSSSWQEISSEPYFNIGLIIDSTCITDAHVSAINKPASRCHLTSLVVLHPTSDETNSTSSMNDSVGKWLESNKVSSADVECLDSVGTGQGGWEEMLRSDSIHAVYIIVPPSSQKDYVLQALNAKKHVLANDPTSVKLSDFMEELECAEERKIYSNNCHVCASIQSSALFESRSTG